MKKQSDANYLEYIPRIREGLRFTTDPEGNVTILQENRGFFCRITQILLKKPAVSQIHLETMGSFIWPLIDGERDILRIGEHVKERFGDEAEPLYERLSKYMKILESCGFITVTPAQGSNACTKK